MRPSGLTSTGPKAAKSTSGTRGSAAPADSARGGPVSAFLTNALTSSSLMRPLSPLPVTRARSTPSSRAKRRTAGLACALRMSGSAAPADARGRSRRAGRGVGRRGRCGCGRRRSGFRGPRGGRRGRLAFQRRHDVPGVDAPALGDVELRDRPGRRRRHVHRRLVRLERHQRRFEGDRVALLHQDLDDFDVLEVAEVRHAHLERRRPRSGAGCRGGLARAARSARRRLRGGRRGSLRPPRRRRPASPSRRGRPSSPRPRRCGPPRSRARPSSPCRSRA